MIASCLAAGKTKLRNCALEPEVKDLIFFLRKMGSKIKWVGKRDIDITGIKNFKPVTHKVIFDRIEAGTYIIASALTNGCLKINNINPKIISTEISFLKKMGINFINKKNYLITNCSKKLKVLI